MLRRFFGSFAFIAVAGSLALAGCATTGAVSDSDEEVAAATEAASDSARGPHGPGKHHGPPRGHELLVVALSELDLTAEQRKTIEGALDAMGEKDHAAMAAMGKVLASGVRAGKIDAAAVKAKAAELEQQAEGRRAAVGKALDTLHATLTPAQREALVAKVEEHMQSHPPPFGRPNDEGKGRGPEGEERGPEGHGRGPGRMGHGPHGPLGFLLHDLELSDEQREKIHAGLEAARPDKPTREEMEKKHGEMLARQKAVLESFRGAKFDGAAALPDKPAGEPPVVHLVEALDVIVPVLDADQREALAKRLEEGPPRMGMGGGKHGRHGGPEGGPQR